MKTKLKTVRDITSRPTNSSIPRTEGSLFLMLNRLSTERERLQQDEIDLVARLEQKRQRMVHLEAEMQHYKNQIEFFHTPAAPRSVASATAKASPASIIEMETEEPTQWQPLVVEY